MGPAGLLAGTYAVAWVSHTLVERPAARLTARLLQRYSTTPRPLPPIGAAKAA